MKRLAPQPIRALASESLSLTRSWRYRAEQRRRIAAELRLPDEDAPLRPGTITGIVRIKNEDFWIELILRTACKVLDEVIVIDTGSTDETLSILKELAREGLAFRLIEHREDPALFNLVVNLILRRLVTSEFFYLIDGDELQLEPSLQRLRSIAAAVDGRQVWQFACHHLFIHPADFCRCTPPYCPQVRFMAGRVYNRRRMRLSEVVVNDGLELANGLPARLGRYPAPMMLEDVFNLHCPLSQRSTIRSWQGNASVPTGSSATGYRKRYLADDSAYIRLPFFPKELLECRYSDHNVLFGDVLRCQIPLI